MKKKNLIIGIITVILLILLVNKVLILNEYKSEKRGIDQNNFLSKVISILYYVEPSEAEIATYEEITFKNYFEGYENNNNFKVKYDENGNIKSYYSISKTEQYIDMLNINSFKIYTDKDLNEYDYKTTESMKQILKNNNINNDVDFLNYIKLNYHHHSSNIFTKVETIKNNFIINEFVNVTLLNYDELILINRNLSGFIFVNQNMKEIHLINGSDKYIITLSGEDITNDEFVRNLLESVKFIEK